MIVDQAHNNTFSQLLHGPTARAAVSVPLPLSDRLYTPTLIRPDNELWEKGTSLSDEFDSLDPNEKAGIGATLMLIRCRVLAAKIANELRNKRPERSLTSCC
jgi:hypothetical protein